MSSVSSRKQSQIALVDCNNFFAACERVFHPEWEHLPLAVLSHNDGRVIARSNEVKALGVEMGAPYFQVKKLLAQHKGIIVSGNHALYSDLSARVMSILSNFTPDLEVYSIDEAFLDLTGFEGIDLTAYCQTIVKTIRQWTGIPVSIGIASTKVLAKAATRLVKRGKIAGSVLDFTNNQQLDLLLAGMKVGDLWGIGSATAEKLQKYNLHNARQLKHANLHKARRLFGLGVEKVITELNGTPCFGLAELVAQKQIMVSRSFGQKITDKKTIAEAITSHITKAGEKLRQQQSVAGIVVVFIATSPYNKQQAYLSPSATIKLPAYSADTLSFISAALQGLERIFRPGYSYAKAGVMLHDIHPAKSRQLQLFNPEEDTKSQKLMAVLDELNSLHGQGTVYSACEGSKQVWQAQKQFLSPGLSSSWESLPIVN